MFLGLLRLAHKYNIADLTSFCVDYLMDNISLDNALDVLITAHLTNQDSLFDVTANFIWAKRGNLVKTEWWKELSEKNPRLVAKLTNSMLKLE